jgi:hypothetical protein
MTVQEVLSSESRAQTLSLLYELLQSCMTRNWDGDDAEPINNASYQNAVSVINQLPLQTEMPDVSLTPYGDEAQYLGRKSFRV